MANSQQPEQPKAKGREFAIAQDPIWKKQDQEQKRFLRQSQDKDSRELVAIRTDQAIQRARSRALKAVYAKGELTILVEIPTLKDF